MDSKIGKEKGAVILRPKIKNGQNHRKRFAEEVITEKQLYGIKLSDNIECCMLCKIESDLHLKAGKMNSEQGRRFITLSNHTVHLCMESVMLIHIFEEIAIHMTDFGLLYLLGDFLAVTLGFTGLAAQLLLEVDVACFEFTAVHDPVERGEADWQCVCLNDVVRRLTLLEQRRHYIIDVDQFAECQVKAIAAIDERAPVLRMGFAGTVDLADEMAGTALVFKVGTGIADMRRLFQPLAFHFLEFGASFVAGSYTSAAAQAVAGHVPASMMDLAVAGL